MKMTLHLDNCPSAPSMRFTVSPTSMATLRLLCEHRANSRALAAGEGSHLQHLMHGRCESRHDHSKQSRRADVQHNSASLALAFCPAAPTAKRTTPCNACGPGDKHHLPARDLPTAHNHYMPGHAPFAYSRLAASATHSQHRYTRRDTHANDPLRTSCLRASTSARSAWLLASMPWSDATLAARIAPPACACPALPAAPPSRDSPSPLVVA
jgi:hypothetical protein